MPLSAKLIADLAQGATFSFSSWPNSAVPIFGAGVYTIWHHDGRFIYVGMSRNFYLDNKFAQGDLTLDDLQLDLRKVKVPIYNLATQEDHITPAKSVLHGSKYFGGPTKFVLAGSGHIAGVINPPDLHKYRYWTGPEPTGSDVDKWLAKATEHAGSWWPDWLDWLRAQDSETVPARAVGSGQFKPIEDAPGSYVKIRS